MKEAKDTTERFDTGGTQLRALILYFLNFPNFLNLLPGSYFFGPAGTPAGFLTASP